jgi:ArsR family transcriptional regulator
MSNKVFKINKIALGEIGKSCVMVSQILKALSHPQRLMIMGHLLVGEKTVTDLVNACDVSQPQMSQFLIRMRSEGLIRCRRDGKYQFYSVADDRLAKLMKLLYDEYCDQK